MATQNIVDVGLAGSTGTGNFVGSTSPTITTPRIVTELNDVNGNPMIFFNATASANNYFSFLNSVSGGSNAIGMTAVGADTNIIMSLSGKGTGGAQVKGTGTNDNSSTGYVGEFVSSVIASASAVSLSTATAKNMTSISLTAGDWNVQGDVHFGFTGLSTLAAGWISTTSATLPDYSLYNEFNYTSGTSTAPAFNVPFVRISIAATTTVYISAYATFSTGTATVCGGIYARRVR